MAPESNEKSYLRNAFVAGSLLIGAPLIYGAVRGFPEGFYAFAVPILGGCLLFVYALENSIRAFRERIEQLERRERERSLPPPAAPAPRREVFDPGARRPSE